jgi:hypothetical protein
LALLLVTTAVAAVAGGGLAVTLGPNAALGWFAVLLTSFAFSVVAILLSEALGSAASFPSTDFNRSLETLTLTAGVLAPLATHFVSYWLAPHQSENISIVAAYFARKDAGGGHGDYLNVVAWTCAVSFTVAVVAVILARAGDDLWAAVARLINEGVAFLVLFASSLLLLPWVPAEQSSASSASALGELIANQIVFITLIATLLAGLVTIVRSFPAALRAARGAALSLADIALQIVAGLVASVVVLALIVGLLWFLASAVPFVGSASRSMFHAGATAVTAVRPVMFLALSALAQLVALICLGVTVAWLAKRAIRMQVSKAQLRLGLTIAAVALAAAVLFAIWRMLSVPSLPPPSPQITFRESDVACLEASWMMRETNRATMPVEKCFPIDDQDARFVVAIGDATRGRRPATEEARALRRAQTLAEALEARYPALSGRFFALNVGVTSQSANRFEANRMRAIVATVNPQGGSIDEAKFLTALRTYLSTRGIGPHTVCRLYRLNSANAVGARFTEIENVACKPAR